MLEFLEKRGVVPLRECVSRCSSTSSVISKSSGNVQVLSSPPQAITQTRADASPSVASALSEHAPTPSPAKRSDTDNYIENESRVPVKASNSLTQTPHSDSGDSLSVKTKDSIEDLPSHAPRSPKSPKSPRIKKDNQIPPSPTKSPKSPRHRLRRKLTLNLNGVNFDVEKRKRPLSPFTSGGMLRKASQPQTAPAAVTEFGPNVKEEVQDKLQKEKPKADIKECKDSFRSTAEERGGKTLMGFLGRRLGSGKGA